MGGAGGESYVAQGIGCRRLKMGLGCRKPTINNASKRGDIMKGRPAEADLLIFAEQEEQNRMNGLRY